MSLFQVQTQDLALHKGFKMKINEATVCAYYGFNATNSHTEKIETNESSSLINVLSIFLILIWYLKKTFHV